MTCFKKAFSLLEMMIIIVILLIISIVAYPTLNNYLIQSKVTDAVLAAAPLQTMVTNQIASLGSVTGSGNNLNTPTSISRYVSAYSINANGVISITTSPNAGGISFTLSPTYDATSEQVSWTCAVSDADMNDMVPSQCRI